MAEPKMADKKVLKQILSATANITIIKLHESVLLKKGPLMKFSIIPWGEPFTNCITVSPSPSNRSLYVLHQAEPHCIYQESCYIYTNLN